MSDCIFCKIVSGELPSNKVYEDDDILAFLDINPVNPGHTIVIPKEHGDNFLLQSEETNKKLISVIYSITPSVLKSVNATDCNVTMNCGSSAGQIIFHTHFHIIPRFKNDLLF